MGKTEIVIALVIVLGTVAVYNYNAPTTTAESSPIIYDSMTRGTDTIQESDTVLGFLSDDYVRDLLRVDEAKSYTKGSEFLNAAWVYDGLRDEFQKSVYARWTPERSTLTFNDKYTITWENSDSEPIYIDTMATYSPTGAVQHFSENSGFLDSIMKSVIPILTKATGTHGTKYGRKIEVAISARGVEKDGTDVTKLEGVSKIMELPSTRG